MDSDTTGLINDFIRNKSRGISRERLDIAYKRLLEDLNPNVYPRQYYFGSDNAVRYLHINFGMRMTVYE